MLKISAGFPSPADDWLEEPLDLNNLLVSNPPATFLLRVSGNSMKGACIDDGSILVVDRSKKATPGRIVVAAVNNELTVKRYIIEKGRGLLRPENEDYSDIPIDENTIIWGVVTGSVLVY